MVVLAGYALSSLAAPGSMAQTLQVTRGECGAPVHLVARGVRYSQVLQRLSEVLAFKLQFDTANDPVVDVDMVRESAELVSRISSGDNLIVTTTHDPRCPKHLRIAKVWVLPKGTEAPRAAARVPVVPGPPGAPAEDPYYRSHGEKPPL